MILGVQLLTVGLAHGGAGSRRYARGLEAGLRSLAETAGFRVSMFAGTPARSVSRGSEQLLLGCWALTGLPAAASLPGHVSGGVAHAVESVAVPRGGKVPLVVTAHDVFALVHPELVGWKLALLKRLTWRRAGTWDAIIVPSHATKDHVTGLGVAEDRVTVIRHGLSATFGRSITEAANRWVDGVTGGRPFVLHVGPPAPKKGTDTLLGAWKLVAPTVSGVLVLLGGRSVGTRREARARVGHGPSQWPEAVIVLSDVSDEQLVALYARASAVAVPSRWEGYSFPVAEALACGAPVIASDIPAHREFGAEGVRLHAVTDEEELAELLRSALESFPERRLRSFPDWMEVAQQHLDVYARVADDS